MSMETLFTQKKICSRCNEPKLLKEFDTYKRNGKYSFQAYCNECRKKDDKSRYRKLTNIRKYQKSNRKRLYGLSQAEFELMLVEQDFKCACCKQELYNPCVDHDHATNEIRSLLCSKCNLIVGHCNESIDLLQKVIEYLKGA